MYFFQLDKLVPRLHSHQFGEHDERSTEEDVRRGLVQARNICSHNRAVIHTMRYILHNVQNMIDIYKRDEKITPGYG